MLLSIIIPVFNVERYIDKCLNTLLSCDLSDCEILLVLGQSSDKSNQTCTQYAQSYSNVVIVKQEGQGLSNARNCGFKNSAGAYISYIDSDDYVSPHHFSRILKLLHSGRQFDVLVTDFERVTDGYEYTIPLDHVYQIGPSDELREGMGHLPSMLRKKQCFWNVWRYIYRKSFLDRHHILFWEGMFCEDMDYTTKVLLLQPDVIFWHCPYYVYRVGRGDSLMGQVTEHRVESTITVLSTCIREVASSDFIHRNLLVAQYQFEYILTMAQIWEVPADARRRTKELFLEALVLLSFGNDVLLKIIRNAIRILGVSVVSKLLYMAKCCKRRLKKMRTSVQLYLKR